MGNTTLLYPAFLMMLLTFYLYGKNFFTNLKELKKKTLSYGYFRAYQGESPEHVEVLRQTLKNQFELPIFFYFLISVCLILNNTGKVDIAFAWIFVISRYTHCYIRLSSNYIPVRAKIFQIGVFSLIFWMLYILYNIL